MQGGAGGQEDRKENLVAKNINDLVMRREDLGKVGETPEDAMSRAYREEFARIMGANNKGFLEAPPSQLLKPNFLGSPLFPGMEGFPRPPGDIQQALTMYQEELTRSTNLNLLLSLLIFIALWFKRGMGPKIQGFISGLFSTECIDRLCQWESMMATLSPGLKHQCTMEKSQQI